MKQYVDGLVVYAALTSHIWQELILPIFMILVLFFQLSVSLSIFSGRMGHRMGGTRNVIGPLRIAISIASRVQKIVCSRFLIFSDFWYILYCVVVGWLFVYVCFMLYGVIYWFFGTEVVYYMNQMNMIP